MTRTPHFFKVKSRIGLTSPPIRNRELNNGVEDAPDFLLTKDLLENFNNPEIDNFIFSNPEDITDNYWPIVAKESKNLKNLINQKIKPNEIQIVIGGDNTVTLPSLEAVVERVSNAEQVGYIQFDSHGEMHQSKTSLSGNFHGMYMRPFFDKFDIPEIDDLVLEKLKTSQILTIGDILFDGEKTEEEQFYQQNKIRNINVSEFDKDKENVLSEINHFLKSYQHIHINFDIDVFHRSVSSATGLPEDGRWFKEQIFTILDLIANHKSISLDLVEINPKKEGAEKTIKLAQDILLKLIN